MTPAKGATLGRIGLITGALVWGLIWYPYRALEQGGVPGVSATAVTYGFALAFMLLITRISIGWRDFTPLLIVAGIAAGGCNLGYLLAVLDGKVIRVLLLFYLAPLWTMVLARCMLGERLSPQGGIVMVLAVGGAFVMLYRVDSGIPLPRGRSEWLGLASGFLFALSNVLLRRAGASSLPVKTVSVFAGVLLATSISAWYLGPQSWQWQPNMASLLAMCGLGIVLLATNTVVQFGLTQTSANQAIVIFLLELVVGAFSAWLLEGELPGLAEWFGGGMIVAATVFSERLAGPKPTKV